MTTQARARVFRSEVGSHLFAVDGSRIYDLEPADADRLEAALTAGREPSAPVRPYIDGRPLLPPPLYSISLNVAQACNMSCGYCYADAGRFGGKPRMMDAATARASVDRLIAESAPGPALVLGFMGGEPLLNRAVVHETTRYAWSAARAAGLEIRFSITTNLTAALPADARLFAEFPFTVSISVDGGRDTHDGTRRMADGSGSYDLMAAGLETLRRHGRPRHLAARATVTPRSGELTPILDHLIELGFDEAGFAAVLASPDPALAFAPEELGLLLERMTACGRKALGELAAGRRYPFGNLETALQQLHRGTHRPYPCGAGAAYLSASAEGRLFACHRLIDEPAFRMGTVQDGPDDAARAAHLERSHVDRIEPCRTCWARYLCGGGCYHEVLQRGRVGCDYIRGWLDFCLRAYAELSSRRPEYFESACSASVSSATTLS